MQQSKIYDIAGAAGVSLATVSRVLNHPEKVSKETRDRVLAIVEAKRYVPNSNARNLASRKTTCVAIVVPTLLRATSSELIQGVYDAASKAGYSVRLFIKDFAFESDPIQWEEVIKSGVDGILFVNDELDKATYNFIKTTPFPVVFVNTLCDSHRTSSVVIDYEGSAYQITKNFIDKGKKNILYINTIHYYQTNEQRLNGYKKAMAEAGLKENIIATVGDLDVNSVEFREYLDKNGAPEVVIATRDSMGISFMNEAQKKGIKVPADMEVVGLQSTRYALLSNPTLTCVESPVYEIGRVAMVKIKELMESDENPKHEKIVVPYKIIKRESTK